MPSTKPPIEKARYGDPFPEHEQIIGAVIRRERKASGVFAKGLFETEQTETRLLVCAGMEKIVWGRVRPETDAAIKKVAGELGKLVSEAREREAAWKAGRRTENLSNQNKSRSQPAESTAPPELEELPWGRR